MPLWLVRAFLFIAMSGGATPSPPASNQPSSSSSNLAGAWVLNPTLTQRPEEIGFSRDWARGAGAGDERSGRSGGGRGRRGGGSEGGAATLPPPSRESLEDSTRVQQLTGEARTPPARLTIVQKADSVSIADDQGHARTFHPNGKLEELTIGTVALPTTARWDAGALVVLYDVENGRQLRYTYTPSANPATLRVDIRFLERGREGDEVRLTYEPPDAHNRAVLAGASPSAAAATPPAPLPPEPSSTMPARRPRVLPPGSELRGLTTIGTTVDELSGSAAACGLDQGTIKTTIARVLSEAGFKTERFGNEDTFVLLSIVTSRLPDGMCISRYDASLVAQADATFPYLDGLVSVPVQLLHEGGMTGGSPAVHAKSVVDALSKSVSSFASQIRAANK